MELMETILVIEDDTSLREVLCTVLQTGGFSVLSAASAEESLPIFSSQHIDCVLADFKLPQMNGIELLRKVRESLPHLPYVLMTAFGSIAVAVEALKSGASDYIAKPFEPASLAGMLRDVIKHNRIVDRDAAERSKRHRAFLTSSPQLEKILAQARHVARVDSSVLILGESGTGKEVLARYLHDHSPRHDKPFIAVNCAAIPPDLLESEFFGHESGAFTGATQSRVGVLELASAGTVFLDEVGDMPPLLQVKLLRALQEHEIRRVGGNKQIRVNPRVIAATNRDVEAEMVSGEMRDDFYYRLAVITFNLPPLRERKEDIMPLVERSMRHFAAVMGKETISIDPVAQDMLLAYAWPGNVRELENVVERAVLMCDNEIRAEHLGIYVRLDIAAIEESIKTLPEIASQAVRKAEVEAIERALHVTGGNKSKAADLLGVSYKTLLNKVRDYSIVCGSAHGHKDEELTS
jgi:DNA-binding NtrC family response regulator